MERSRYNLHSPPPPFLHSPSQHHLMTEVHAVEVPESDDYSAHNTTSARASSPSSLYTANNSPSLITL